MMGKRFARIVEECLHRLDRGENLPDVLLDFPAEAERLKPLLLVAMASRSMAVPIPDPAARIQGRAQMISEMDQAGAGGNLARSGFLAQLQSWVDKVVNASRSRGLLRPTTTPSYRLALIALVVIFGSGWFVVSASASPGELFKALTEDIQQVLAFLNRDPSDTPPDYLKLISISEGGASPFTVNRAAKVVFLRDFLDDEGGPAKSQYAINLPDRSSSPDPAKPLSTPNPAASQEDPALSPDDPQQGPGDLPVPCPHPASAVVNEVVSDTAKEKNPVWDQLPFNQSDGDPVCEDQAAAEEEGCDLESPTCILAADEDEDDDDFDIDDDEEEDEEVEEEEIELDDD